MFLSRFSLENHYATKTNIVTTLSQDLNSALSLCSLPKRTNDILKIVVWLGNLPKFRSSLSNISSNSTILSSVISELIAPLISDNQNELRGVISKYPRINFTLNYYQPLINVMKKSSELVNYVLFLTYGDFYSFLDRILRIRYSAVKQFSVTIDDEYFLFEKHLIRALCDLLSVLIPLVQGSVVYRKVSQKVMVRGDINEGHCVRCSRHPVNVVWTGCGHVHCHCCLEDLCGLCGERVCMQTCYYP